MHRLSLGALSAIIAFAFTSIGTPATAAAPDERRPGHGNHFWFAWAPFVPETVISMASR